MSVRVLLSSSNASNITVGPVLLSWFSSMTGVCIVALETLALAFESLSFLFFFPVGVFVPSAFVKAGVFVALSKQILAFAA